MKRSPSIIQAVAPMTVLTLVLFAAEECRADAQVYERTLRSTAWIVSPVDKGDASIGTGFVADAHRKWVVTNYHVVEERKKALVFFPQFRGDRVIAEPNHYTANAEKNGTPGQVIAVDKKRDLAIVEVKSLPSGIFDLTLAPRSPRPGETVHSIGNSGANDGALWRYSKGEVRQVYSTRFKAKDSGGTTLEIEARVVETQVPTNVGDSGGPVVNDKGELVAVTQSNSTKQRLVSYSIDVGEVRSFLRSSILREKTNRSGSERWASAD
jgi:S1-C subfamily serine protease